MYRRRSSMLRSQVREEEPEVALLAGLLPGVLAVAAARADLGSQLGRHAARLLVVAARDPDQARLGRSRGQRLLVSGPARSAAGRSRRPRAARGCTRASVPSWSARTAAPPGGIFVRSSHVEQAHARSRSWTSARRSRSSVYSAGCITGSVSAVAGGNLRTTVSRCQRAGMRQVCLFSLMDGHIPRASQGGGPPLRRLLAPFDGSEGQLSRRRGPRRRAAVTLGRRQPGKPSGGG